MSPNWNIESFSIKSVHPLRFSTHVITVEFSDWICFGVVFLERSWLQSMLIQPIKFRYVVPFLYNLWSSLYWFVWYRHVGDVFSFVTCILQILRQRLQQIGSCILSIHGDNVYSINHCHYMIFTYVTDLYLQTVWNTEITWHNARWIINKLMGIMCCADVSETELRVKTICRCGWWESHINFLLNYRWKERDDCTVSIDVMCPKITFRDFRQVFP